MEGPVVFVGDLKFAVAGGVGEGTIATNLISEEFAAALTGSDGVKVEGNTLSGRGGALVFPTGFVYSGDRRRNTSAEGEKSQGKRF